MTVAFVHDLMNLLIAGFILRSLTAFLLNNNPDSSFGKALAFLY